MLWVLYLARHMLRLVHGHDACAEKLCKGPKYPEVLRRGMLYLMLHCHKQDGSALSHRSLFVRSRAHVSRRNVWLEHTRLAWHYHLHTGRQHTPSLDSRYRRGKPKTEAWNVRKQFDLALDLRVTKREMALE